MNNFPPHSRLALPSQHLYRGHTYTPACETDLKRLFERLQREIKRSAMPDPLKEPQ